MSCWYFSISGPVKAWLNRWNNWTWRKEECKSSCVFLIELNNIFSCCTSCENSELVSHAGAANIFEVNSLQVGAKLSVYQKKSHDVFSYIMFSAQLNNTLYLYFFSSISTWVFDFVTVNSLCERRIEWLRIWGCVKSSIFCILLTVVNKVYKSEQMQNI